MSKNELSFDEFRAVLNREKNLKNNKNEDTNSSYLDGNYTHSLTHSLTHLLTHSHTYLLTHSLTHLLTHSLTHLFTHLLTHSLTHSPTHSPTHLLTHYNLFTQLPFQKKHHIVLQQLQNLLRIPLHHQLRHVSEELLV